ncbi:hypothetical protein EV44_g4000 [Erysiphe necator]|uniref:Uncharacterized protein n=1 Tax=Uncinula necator TaxID=52586 RepID=A0A0B1PC68_UNCNE|nr:hypothetical protein EV44_g4000 [Erysiphe necator]
MSPLTTPTRAQSILSPLSPTPTNRSRTIRFTNVDLDQPVRYSSEALYNPQDPFISPDIIPSNKSKGNISKFTEDVFDEIRDVMIGREQMSEEFSKAIDEATSSVQKLGLEHALGHLERGQASSSKPTYAEAIKTYPPNTHKPNLPPKPSKPLPNHTARTRKRDNRIFVRLPENHPSRAHHVHAVKSALVNKLGPEGAIVKTIQKVKLGLAIVPAYGKQAEQILKNSQVFTSVLGGAEKAEKWLTYVIDHVPRKPIPLDDESWDVTEDDALAEVQSITSLLPTKVVWSKKTLENPLPLGAIVSHFKQATNPFRLFGTSSMARLIIKSPTPIQGVSGAELLNTPIAKQLLDV